MIVHQVRVLGDALLELRKAYEVWPSSHALRDRYRSSTGLSGASTLHAGGARTFRMC